MSCLFTSISIRMLYSSFQGGRFDKFPFLQKLIIWNPEPLKNEQHHSSTFITFNHLFELNVMYAHSDYVIQFFLWEKHSFTLFDESRNWIRNINKCDKLFYQWYNTPQLCSNKISSYLWTICSSTKLSFIFSLSVNVGLV